MKTLDSIVPPPHALHSSSGLTWLDEDGIIMAVGAPQELHTLEHAMENHEINMKLAGGIKRPFLIDMTRVKSMSNEARKFYAGPEPQKILTAVALLTQSNFGKLVANFFIGLAKPALPTRMFTDLQEARSWLLQQHKP